MWRRLHLTLLSLLLLALPATTVLCGECVGGDCAMGAQKLPAAVPASEMPPCHAAMGATVQRQSSASSFLAADGSCCQMSAPSSMRTAVSAPHILDQPGFELVSMAGAPMTPTVMVADDRGAEHRPPKLRPPLYTLHSSLLI